MTKLRVSKSRDYLIDQDGEKYFYLSDTVWSAFTNASIKDWEKYLDYRAQQGFNVLQINILRQIDASNSDFKREPFKIDEDGNYDFFTYNEEYFANAKKMLSMAVERGFTPALVVLWYNYVPDTRKDIGDEVKNQVMPERAVKPYVEYAVSNFKEYDPIYIISGDTDFPSAKAKDYYMTALKTIKSITPEALTTFHLGNKPEDLADEFVESDYLDFYMYQSGHGFNHIDTEDSMSYALAKQFYNKPVKRPIINGEPCYEGMGIVGEDNRFGNYDIRKDVWQSLLSGAKAGITYGAHGIWSWHKKEQYFEGSNYWGTPFDVMTALRFEGAWDAAFSKNIFEKYDLFDLEPVNEIINGNHEMRMSANSNRFVIYLPYATGVELKRDLGKYEIDMIDLQDRKYIKPEVLIKKNSSIIKMYQANTDILIIGYTTLGKK